MTDRFLSRGYNRDVMRRAVDAMDTIQRSALLQNKKKKRLIVEVPVFSTPYSLEFGKIRRIIEWHISIHNDDETYAKVLSRRAPALGNALLPSYVFQLMQPKENMVRLCS